MFKLFQKPPILFRMKFRGEIKKEVKFNISDGNVFEPQYISSENYFQGLKCLLQKYDCYSNCVIFFDYMGNSSFNVCI